MELMAAERKISMDELRDKLGVSIETIRRDLKAMEEQGLLRRVYGGAVIESPTNAEPEFLRRKTLQLAEKRAIAIEVAKLIANGDTVVIDSGTTTLEVTRQLGEKNELTVLTNSMHNAVLLLGNPTNSVYMLGGLLRPYEHSVHGPMCLNDLEAFRVDKAIIGIGGISVENGVTDFFEPEAHVRGKMMKIAKQVIVAADYTKVGAAAFCKICDIDRVHTLVTDWRVGKQSIAEFRRQNINVVVAPPPAP